VTKAPKNVVASVLARLRNVAQEAGLSFNDILQFYVIERFLSRLSRSPHANTVLLKGALMLRVWGVPRARPTMDIDLLRRGVADQAALVRLVEQCAAISDLSDGVIFEPTTISVEPIRDATEYVGTRIRLHARLDWILSRTLAFSGPALSQAIRSTFDRRQTSVPVVPPAALTAKFYSEPGHVRQWAAFVGRIGEPALANEFPQIVADLTKLEPLGPWQHGRSSKI